MSETREVGTYVIHGDILNVRPLEDFPKASILLLGAGGGLRIDNDLAQASNGNEVDLREEVEALE